MTVSLLNEIIIPFVRSEWKTLPGSATKWATDEALDLKIGALCKIRVSAVNGAGLTAVHYTDGLLVDPTPPEVYVLHAFGLAQSHACFIHSWFFYVWIFKLNTMLYYIT